MDKELLRIVIIALGVTIIMGMVLWSLFKNKKSKRGIDFYDKGNPLENIDDSLIINTGNDDFDIVPLGSALDEDLAPELDPVMADSDEYQPEQSVSSGSHIDIPPVIQFSLVASANAGFNGEALIEAFQKVGLEYGSMKVFERLDELRRVDFAVASMVEPGIFPESELKAFNSPGLVFFMQPGELENPLDIFEEFIQTINLLATELGGNILDQNRQPLSEETIQQFRSIL